jgi:hypothetical protein
VALRRRIVSFTDVQATSNPYESMKKAKLKMLLVRG